MDDHLVRRAYQRALLMKQFEREDHDPRRYQEFIESFFDKILDYRQERDWEPVLADNCQEYLKFPKVLNTQTADTPDHIRHDSNVFSVYFIGLSYLNHSSFFALSNYQPKNTLTFLNTTEYIEKNFDCQLLDDNSTLWSEISGSNLMDGYTYDCIRFKIPFNYVQSGFNRPSYRGFILYSKVNRWNANQNDLELERLPIYDKRHPNWYFRHTIRFWFCSCRSGSRYE